MFDPILRDFAAAQAGVQMRYRTRLTSFTQDPDGVTAEVENVATGERDRIRADYLVGCDGGRSLVRETLAIPMVGTATLTLSGTQTQINTALATVSYLGNANFNGTDSLTVLSTDTASATASSGSTPICMSAPTIRKCGMRITRRKSAADSVAPMPSIKRIS